MEFLGTVFGLSSAASWGVGDFAGGIATKSARAMIVATVAYLVGLGALLILALLSQETMITLEQIVWSGLAGVFGAISLVALYKGLSGAEMGLVAPLFAVVAAVIPVVVSFFTYGSLSNTKTTGIIVAIPTIWFLAGDAVAPTSKHNILLAGIAGTCSGLFLVFINQGGATATFWPLIIARFCSVILLTLISCAIRQIEIPTITALPLMLMAGIFDIGGNIFFLLSAKLAPLGLAAILSSLSPAVTVILARTILNERITKRKWFCLGAILIAIVLITF
jgi:drug/metabolite transporter (DMT)-like permease